MMDGGWIKIHRKMLDSSIFANEKMLKVWLWCLFKANWEDKKNMIGNREIEVKRGQFIFGRKKASIELDIPPTTVNRLIHKLADMKMIELKVDSKWTLVTIENYAKYQDDDSKRGQIMDSQWTDNGQIMDSQWTDNGQSVDTTKNIKNIKNNKKEKKVKKEKNNIRASSDADALFEQLWQLYPKKRGKANVSDKQKQKLLDIGYDNMAKAIHRYVDECQEAQYMKQGSTFFNSGYVDYLDENYEALPISSKPNSKADEIYEFYNMASDWGYEDDETRVYENSNGNQDILSQG